MDSPTPEARSAIHLGERESRSLETVSISGGGLTAEIMPLGATLRDLRLDGHPAPLVLGLEELSAYRTLQHYYFGAIVGRWANRIAGASFQLDGQTFRLDDNEGEVHLHGGRAGYSSLVWEVADQTPNSVRLILHDADSHMGYPGAVDVAVTYTLEEPAVLSLDIVGHASANTIFNPSSHIYFNLEDGGSGSIAEHVFRIAADRYLPVDGHIVPTGIAPVAGTIFDFRRPKPLPRQAGKLVGYDTNFCIADNRGPLHPVAAATAPSGVSLTIASTEPGLQFYTGQKLGKLGGKGLGGRNYGAFAGFALEPQVWPDAPNRSDFPSGRLEAGASYRHTTTYTFDRGGAQ
jgi:aldose 1-epimerase